MTSRRLARALLVVVTPPILVSCTAESSRPTGPLSASTLPHPDPSSHVTVLNPGQWPPQLKLEAVSWADFGWGTANVRSYMYWGPVANCGDAAPQRRFGQQSDGSYAQGPPPQTVTAFPPANEVTGSRITAYMWTRHVFFEGSAYDGGYYEEYITGDTLCLDAPTPPPAPPLTASISGPSSISPDGYCSWYGSASGGASPYTLTWTRNGEAVSSSSSYTAETPGGYFGLQFAVMDAYGRTASASLFVAEDANGVSCPF